MEKLLISNLVYGDPYTDIFLDYHIKSILDTCAKDDFPDGSLYLIFTDGNNIDKISNHINFYLLSQLIGRVNFITIKGEINYENRYAIQTAQLQESIKIALNESMLVHIATADLYYGPQFIKGSVEKITINGADAVFSQAMRCAYESTAKYLKQNTVESVDALFEIAFNNLHPLWTSSNWDNPYFSKIPYQIIWADSEQIICRGFSISSTFFKPDNRYLGASGCCDMSIHLIAKNKAYINDWSEIPSIELGQLKAFYPPFSNNRSDVSKIADWAKKSIQKENYTNLEYYQVFKKKNTHLNSKIVKNSEDIVKKILGAIR